MVVFGDSEGVVHFLSSATGEPQLRLRTDGSAVIGTPVLSLVRLAATSARQTREGVRGEGERRQRAATQEATAALASSPAAKGSIPMRKAPPRGTPARSAR